MAAVSSILAHKNGRGDGVWNRSIILKPFYMQYATKDDFENGSLDNMGSVGNLVTYILTLSQEKKRFRHHHILKTLFVQKDTSNFKIIQQILS